MEAYLIKCFVRVAIADSVIDSLCARCETQRTVLI